MPLDAIQQKSKTMLEAIYKIGQQKKKVEREKTRQYLLSLLKSVEKDVEEEKNALEK